MDSDIASFYRRIFASYDSIRGKSKKDIDIPFWDIVVITASDDVQKYAYTLQLKERIDKQIIPSGVQYFVFEDPPGPRAGCGTSMMKVISKLKSIIGEELYKMYVLIINCGGHSQRLPSTTVLGKIFMALPMGDPMYQLFDLKLACYLPLLEKMNPGIFAAASDTIEVYRLGDKDTWSVQNPGFTALAHPSSIEIGTGHGVYVLDGEHEKRCGVSRLQTCRKVLQKPSEKEMEENGAIINDFKYPGQKEIHSEPVVYTDSCFYFDFDVANKLSDFYEENKPLDCEIDGYSDFLQALGPESTIDHIYNTANVSKVEPSLLPVREKVYNLLKGTQLSALLLNASKFYHLGTTREYLYHFCEDKNLGEECGFKKQVGSKIGGKRNLDKNGPTENTIKGCVMQSILPTSSTVATKAVVEYSHFSAPIHINSDSIISNCAYTSELKSELTIPPSTFLHTVPIQQPSKEVQFVTAVFQIDDNLKKKYKEAKDVQYMGKTTKELNEFLDISVGKVFPEDSNAEQQPFTLWYAKLFPAKSNMSESLECALSILAEMKGKEKEKENKICLQECDLYSMADVMKLKDVTSMLNYRKKLAEHIENDK